MSVSQQKIFNRLLEEANKSDLRFKHAACICKGKKILYMETILKN